jgi:hypothetical protein
MCMRLFVCVCVCMCVCVCNAFGRGGGGGGLEKFLTGASDWTLSFAVDSTGRMDSYVDALMKNGGSYVTLAKGNRSKQVHACVCVCVSTSVPVFVCMFVCLKACTIIADGLATKVCSQQACLTCCAGDGGLQEVRWLLSGLHRRPGCHPRQELHQEGSALCSFVLQL